MGRYINWDDVVRRYPIAASKGGNDEVDAEFIVPAEYEVESRLAASYTLPFSTDNQTIKDLSIDLVYYRMTLTNKSIDSEELKKYLDDRFKGLNNGTMHMISTSGSAIFADAETAWSSTKDYSPTFDMGHEIDWGVSSEHLLDIETERGY